MNSFNKTEPAIFLVQTMVPDNCIFLLELLTRSCQGFKVSNAV